MENSTRPSDHITIKIPKELVDEMDKLKGVMGFRSRGEIAKEAIRQLVNHYKETLATAEPPKPQIEHFNVSETGVCILDRTIKNGVSNGRIIDVYFRPEGIWCEYCQAKNCRHIRFALTVPKIKEIIKKKRQEGWKLPETE